jgi:hypothetical protein
MPWALCPHSQKVAIMAGYPLSFLNIFSPYRYSASGIGLRNDDTAAFQSAVTACVTNGYACDFPPPPSGGFWNITSTIYLPEGTPTGLTDMHINGTGGFRPHIVWTGPSNMPVFKTTGWRNSIISGVRVVISGGQSGVTVWDIGTNSSGASSTGTLSFDGCHVDLGAGQNNAAWRINHHHGGNADGSCFRWTNCTVYGSGQASGSVGLKVEGGNSLIMNWDGGGGSSLDKFYTNTGGGGGCVRFYGASCSQNNIDFEYGSSDSFTLCDGRYEEGATLLYVLPGTTHASVSLRNVMTEAYGTLLTPGYALLNIDRPVTLNLDNCRFPDSNVTSTNKAIYLGGYSPGKGVLFMDGGGYGFSAANLYTSTTPSGGAVWTVYRRGVSLLDGTGQATSVAADVP